MVSFIVRCKIGFVKKWSCSAIEFAHVDHHLMMNSNRKSSKCVVKIRTIKRPKPYICTCEVRYMIFSFWDKMTPTQNIQISKYENSKILVIWFNILSWCKTQNLRSNFLFTEFCFHHQITKSINLREFLDFKFLDFMDLYEVIISETSCWFNAKILDFQLWPESEWRLPFCHSDRWSVAYFGQQPVLSCWHQKDGCWKVFCSHLPHLHHVCLHIT